MLLRQALEQTRAGMPPPVLFNSSIVVLHHTDEVSAMVRNDAFDRRFHAIRQSASVRASHRGSAAQLGQGQPHLKAATLSTGAQAS